MSKIKKIYCIHHSHFDLGYTHPQELILEHQEDYISQAIELCEKYKEEEHPFRWTIEATLPLVNWLADATIKEINQVKQLVKNNLLSITALPMHTTPLNDAFQLKKLLEYKKVVEDKLDCKITTAINHDINGQAWSFADILLDSGVDFYLTGENIHFGGIPFSRPKEFYWEAPSGRKLLSFLGEHYSLFSQFMETDKRDVSLMKSGLEKYIDHLDKKNYQKDFVILTATNPPLLDNNSPDFGLFDLITEFNKTVEEYQIEFITPEMLKKFLSRTDEIESVKGDWTDFWNFGAGSTPYEVKYSKVANQNIKKANLFEAFSNKVTNHYQRVKKSALLNALIYNEHTWGAANSVTDSFSLQAVIGKNKKAGYCFDALSQSAYILNKIVDQYHHVEDQNEEIKFITATNTSSHVQVQEAKIPQYLLDNTPYLSSFKSNIYLHGEKESEYLYGPSLKLAPYETIAIPVDEFKKKSLKKEMVISTAEYQTNHYKLVVDGKTGSIKSLFSKDLKEELVDSSKYGFFDLVVETIDETKNKAERATFFPRDIELANYSISVWNHQWEGKRASFIGKTQTFAYQSDGKLVVETIQDGAHPSISWVKRKITLNDFDGTVKISMRIKRNSYSEPVAHYLTIPTTLQKNWQAVFESADTLYELDDEQLGAVSKDWVTIGNSAAFYDKNKGLYFASSDAPLMQVNGFSFGRESKSIDRTTHPLFLSWLYNNYWDTNFSATDDNEIEHDFIIKPFTKYIKTEQIELGDAASNPIEYSWSSTDEIPQLPLEVDCTNVSILSVEKISEDSIQLFIKNYSNQLGSLALFNVTNKVSEIFKTDLAGEVTEKIDLSETVNLDVAPNSFGYFEIKIKN